MYLETDEGFPGHRKTLRLCTLLKCDTADAYPVRLWAWAVRSAPDGDLTGMDPAEIEMAVRYRRMDGKLFEALVGAGFIDRGEDGSLAISRDFFPPLAPDYGPTWPAQRLAALRRDGGACRVCGDKVGVHVHHVVPLRLFNGDTAAANQLTNLVTLCPRHHADEHRRLRAEARR